MKYIMGIDEGTTGCKACIFDEYGKLVSMAYREYQSYYPEQGWVEQDITEISECVFSSSREAVKSAKRKGVNAEDIVAISHSNVGITFILLDENGKVDPAKLNALSFDNFQSGYYELGTKAGQAWSNGKKLMGNN